LLSLSTVLRFLHLAAALVLFLALGIECTANSFLRRSTTSAEAQTWLRLARLGPVLNGPALAVLLLSGGYLAALSGAMKQAWIPASLLAIAVVFLLGIFVNIPRMRAIRQALPAAGDSLTVALRNPLLASSVRIRTAIALGIVFLMTAKQPFGPSMITLAVACALGIVLSIPLFRKPS
jgi:hypothetical protein